MITSVGIGAFCVKRKKWNRSERLDANGEQLRRAGSPLCRGGAAVRRGGEAARRHGDPRSEKTLSLRRASRHSCGATSMTSERNVPKTETEMLKNGSAFVKPFLVNSQDSVAQRSIDFT
eukprot:Selendium_serpulae@DN6194_c6_g2_i2.p2